MSNTTPVDYSILAARRISPLRQRMIDDMSIAADPKHLGAQIGFFCILHTWGQTLHAHPHLHCVVPGGGISLDGSRWVSCRRRRFFLPVRVLSSRFRNLYLRY